MRPLSRLSLSLAVLTLALLAAAPVGDPAALLRDGDDAFRRGDLRAAAALYERAGLPATAPAAAAFRPARRRRPVRRRRGGPTRPARRRTAMRNRPPAATTRTATPRLPATCRPTRTACKRRSSASATSSGRTSARRRRRRRRASRTGE